ncbi:DUF5667 domain-containing protein [Bacillus sp. T3]|uniref:DUF5667 domain-containing protein n=1 Tax=Bacillus sp. T3 TaxID=467262 RepID=UPI0029826703|nr:DUF5667 domain-containing protein [Bacillus sp. T3]
MNLFSKHQIKKITKGSLALVLASTFSFSSLAFADENTTEQENYETVDLSKLQAELETTQEEAPSVIPGDFFYFAKIAFEKIKLALVFDDAKEAELMATYATERLAEASALYDEGKETEALEVIQTAISYMESSQNIIDEEVATDQDATQETTTDEQADQDSSEAVTNASDDQETAVTDEENSEDNPYATAEDVLRNNIAALTAAMSHVGNDHARASLQKNIDKTNEKIAKKLAKLEKKYGQVEDESDTDDQGTEDTVIDTAPTPTPVTETTEPANSTITTDAGEEITTDSEAVPAAPAVANQAKSQEKAEKASVKQTKQPENAKGKNAQQKSSENKGNQKAEK